MYTHFNQHDPSITDAQDALLQKRLPGKLGNIRLGDLLLDERDKDGNTIDAPPGRLQGYIREESLKKVMRLFLLSHQKYHSLMLCEK